MSLYCSQMPLCISTQHAIQLLSQGEVFAIPTETVYGLAADITQPQAIEKIFSTKRRPFFDPLIVHICDLHQLDDVIDEALAKALPPLIQKLAEQFWPGPLTMVLPKNQNLNPMITSGLDTVGVRMPKHKMALEIIRELKHPLAAPSANLFGQTSPTSAEHVIAEFSGRVPVVDGGPCEVGVESTVIGFNDSFSEIRIYRPGAITQQQLERLAPTIYMNTPVADAPGQLKHHYMPAIPLVVLKSKTHLSVDEYQSLKLKLNIDPLQPSWLNLPNNPTSAARWLYANLRLSAERKGANCILYFDQFAQNKNLPDHINANSDLTVAIQDRLYKAATLVL